MKLFLYYVLHSAKNALKKLFKTWVLIFFLVMLVGGVVVGITVGTLLSHTIPDDPSEPGTEQTDPGWQEEPGEIVLPEDPQDETPVMDILELASGAIILLFFVLGVFGRTKAARRSSSRRT